MNQPKDQNIAIQAKMLEELLQRGNATPQHLQYEPKLLMQDAQDKDINLDQPFCQMIDL